MIGKKCRISLLINRLNDNIKSYDEKERRKK